MGFCAEGEVFGLAFLDISTGELKTCQISGFEPFLSEALRKRTQEILSLKRFQEHPCFDGFKKNFESGLITYLEAPTFDAVPSFNEMERKAILQKAPLAAEAVAMVLHYAEENQKKPISHIRPLSFYQVQDFMVIDEMTKRNLELTQSLFEQGKRDLSFGYWMKP